ncbi:hypothetical protein FOZ60_014259 [Perkinsus olseni]|uniref:Uncharacterized protein n=1 Tax=Perkinsus olseni TaxID=32597 RepID=A0A7J6N882_PEROL|nr:hypothetical protein FOZ60_014259 [Perkinsus olseni]
MAKKNVVMERAPYDLEERDFDKCSISAAGDFLYMAFARPAAIEVLSVQWSRSEDVKLVAAVEVDHRVGQTLLHASPSAPSSLDVLYMTNSVWHHVKLSMVRSHPFIKFEASRSIVAVYTVLSSLM